VQLSHIFRPLFGAGARTKDDKRKSTIVSLTFCDPISSLAAIRAIENLGEKCPQRHKMCIALLFFDQSSQIKQNYRAYNAHKLFKFYKNCARN